MNCLCLGGFWPAAVLKKDHWLSSLISRMSVAAISLATLVDKLCPGPQGLRVIATRALVAFCSTLGHSYKVSESAGCLMGKTVCCGLYFTAFRAFFRGAGIAHFSSGASCWVVITCILSMLSQQGMHVLTYNIMSWVLWLGKLTQVPSLHPAKAGIHQSYENHTWEYSKEPKVLFSKWRIRHIYQAAHFYLQ